MKKSTIGFLAMCLCGVAHGVPVLAALCVGFACTAAFAVEAPMVDMNPTNVLSDVRDGFDLGPDGRYTVATLFTPLLQLDGGRQGIVFAFGSGWFDGFRMNIHPCKDGYTFGIDVAVQKNTPADSPVRQLILNNPCVPAGKPVSFVASWDGKAVRLYVNGREIGAKSHGMEFVPPKNRRLEFGKGGWGLPYRPIAPHRARVWGRALTPDEIASVASEDIKRAPKGMRPATTSAELKDLISKMDAGLDPKAEIEERLVFAYVAEGDIKAAEQSCLRVLARKVRTGSSYDARSEFLERFADALAAAGQFDKAVVLREQARSLAPPGLLAPYVLPKPWTPSARETAPGKPGLEYFISPGGSDDADGSLEHPFATVARAQKAIRQLRKDGRYPKGGVAVNIRGGRYPMLSGLVFEECDSGGPGSPVVWRAYHGEKPVFDGGWRVPGLKPVTDRKVLQRIPAEARGHVRCCDIRAAGYPHDGSVESYGAGGGGMRKPLTDLYADGVWLAPARYPNDRFLRVTGGTQDGFYCDGGGLGDFAQERDLLACGFWRYLWLDMTLTVDPGDSASGRFAVKGKPQHDLSMADGKPFFLCNALCAIDRPGEWMIDSSAGVLYVWPPDGYRELVLSGFSTTFIKAAKLHDVRFMGLAMEYGRWDAVTLSGCSRVHFAGNSVRNFGRHGVTADKANGVVISGNAVIGFGGRGIHVTGGDRRTLAPAENVISGNEIAEVERRIRTYAPGVGVDGCGMDITCNHLHDMPSSAIRIEGNDYRVFSNLVERVVTESDDQGGIDIYRDPSYAGVLIAYNTFRDIGTPKGADDFASCGQAAVRLDGNISGMTIYSNRFERCGRTGFGAVQINGGRNNRVEGNTFVDCERGITINAYPPAQWKRVMDAARELFEKKVDIHSPPYSTKYPGIATLDTQTNQVNIVVGNTLIGTRRLLSTQSPDAQVYGNRTLYGKPDASGK